MSTSKFLSDGGWKDTAAKNNVKDNGLLKKLADFKRIDENQHDEALEALDQALKLAGQIKKDKKTPAAAGKYLDDVLAAAALAVRDLTKAKAEADKAAKAKAELEKKARAQAAKEADVEGDDEEEDSPELLTSMLKPLLRLVAKGQTIPTLVAKSGKKVVVLLSRRPIAPSRRKMLAEYLGGGTTKYYPGHCCLEAGMTTFVLKAEVAGMSKLVKAALLEQTGLRMSKVRCRGEDGDDDDNDDGDAAQASALVSGVASKSEDVTAAVADDEAEQAEAAAAPAAAAPPAPAAEEAEAPATAKQIEVLEDRRRDFKRARAAWVTVKARAEGDLEKVKDGVRMAYLTDPEQFPKVVAGCKEIDSILDNLDDELRDTLDQYASTPLRQQKKLQQLAATAVEILERYQRYVAGNGVMRAIDQKEFADVVVHAPVVKALADLRKSLV